MHSLPRSIAAWLLSATLSTPALADASTAAPALLKDVHASQRGQLRSATRLTPVGNTLYFRHADTLTGSELWKSDGTAAGTSLVKDLLPGVYGSLPENLTEVNGTLFFTTTDGLLGNRLWKSDGTAAGTVQLKYVGLSSISELENVGGTLYFVLESPSTGASELWKSDGTAAGTTRVADPGKGTEGTSLALLRAVGGTLYFTTRAPDGHHELWKSDGTEASTVLVRSGAGLGGYVRFTNLVGLGGTLLLEVQGLGGPQLWKSDGTEAGTVKLANLMGSLREYALGNGRLFFSAGSALWTSDGTPEGTVSLKSFTTVLPQSLVVRDGVLFFSASDDNTTNTARLWKSDGTPAGTTRVLDLPLAGGGYEYRTPLAVAQGTLYFVSSDVSADTLWKSDGTPAGTVKVAELETDDSRTLYTLTAAGGNVYFHHTGTSNPPNLELWRSDGTAAGTGPVPRAHAEPLASGATRWTQLGTSLLFSANDGVHGFEPWKTDGTMEGTVLLKDTVPGDYLYTFGYGSSRFVVRDTTAFFLAVSEEKQWLWKTDGSEAGTVLVKEFPNSHFFSTEEADLVLVGQTLYFTAEDAEHGLELWKSDGTPEGTVLVKDVRAGTASSSPMWLRNVNGTLLFIADDGIHGGELWKSDGTAEGTVLVKDVRPGSGWGVWVMPWTLATVNATLYFTANDGVHGEELWKSDGTPEGTNLVKDVRPGSDGANYVLQATGEALYFTADDGVHGHEPWKSDGTEAGTVMLKDIQPGPAAGYGLGFQRVGNSVIFMAFDEAHGLEPWKTDGTEAGTVLLKDVRPGPESSTFVQSQSSDSVLLPVVFSVEDRGFALFAASDGVHGLELWRTDGTPEGTALHMDLAPGEESSSPQGFARFGDKLVFTATDGTSGQEPRILLVTPQQPVDPTPVVEPVAEEKEGCGCAAGSLAGAGALWSLLALLAGVSVRRRRA